MTQEIFLHCIIINLPSSANIDLHVHVRLTVASSSCVVLITSYQVLDCNLDELNNKGVGHCQQSRYHGHWELPIWIHRQSQMVLLTLFAGDGGYNPQLQRVGEGETFLHGYLTIHVIINPTHNTCNFNTYMFKSHFSTIGSLGGGRQRHPQHGELDQWLVWQEGVYQHQFLIDSVQKWKERGNLLSITFP